MSTQLPQNQPLDEFLVTVNARDLQGDFVVPKDDVRERLTLEIEGKTGIRSSNLTDERAGETFQRWVSAKPGEFITQTRIAVDGICALLTRNGAKSFEIAFHNTKLDPNEWGEKVLLAIRYTRAT
jgi:hypothetical protein